MITVDSISPQLLQYFDDDYWGNPVRAAKLCGSEQARFFVSIETTPAEAYQQ
jgi:hypothetical protein